MAHAPRRIAALLTTLGLALAAPIGSAPPASATSNYKASYVCVWSDYTWLKVTSWWDGVDKVYHFGWRESGGSNGYDREWIWQNGVKLIAEPSGAANPIDIYWRVSGSHANRTIDSTWGKYLYGVRQSTKACPTKPYL